MFGKNKKKLSDIVDSHINRDEKIEEHYEEFEKMQEHIIASNRNKLADNRYDFFKRLNKREVTAVYLLGQIFNQNNLNDDNVIDRVVEISDKLFDKLEK